MAVPVANINYTDTFAGWINKSNQAAYIISTVAVTTAANTTGAVTTGNAAVHGNLSANTLIAGNELRGGTVAASANLTISSNTIFSGLSFFNSNTSFSGANLHITATRTHIASANLFVTSISNFTNNVSFSNTTTFSGNSDFQSNVSITGTTTDISANTNISGDFTASGNTLISGNLTSTGITNLGANTSVTGSQLDISANVNVTSANVVFNGSNINVAAASFSSDIKPSTSGRALGNTSLRWAVFGTTADFSTSLTAANTTLAGTFANVVAQAFFRSNTNFLGTGLNVSSNADFNSATFVVRGGSANIASVTTLNANTTIGGSTLTVSANSTFNQKVIVNGDLNVTGNLTFAATSYADIIPSNSGYALGNTSLRWAVFGTTANFSGNVTATGTTTLNGPVNANGSFSTAGSNVTIATAVSGTPTTNAYFIVNRGSLNNSYIGWDENSDRFIISSGGAPNNIVVADGSSYAISITGSANSALTANNSTNLNGQPASYYANASNLSTGIINSLRLSGNYSINITGLAANSTNLNGQPASYYLAWGNMTGTPNTVNGYGITDAVDITSSQSITGVKTFTSNTNFAGNTSFGSVARQMINLFGTTYGIGVQDLTTYVRTQKGFAVYQGGSHSTVEGDPGSGGEAILLAGNTAFTYRGNTVWHAGNYTPVIKVANTAPNANGDVVLTTVFQGKSANLDVFSARSVGTGSSTSIIDRSSGDSRYAQLSGAAFTGRVDLKTYREQLSNPPIVGAVLTLDLSATNVFNVDLISDIASIVFTGLPPAGVVYSCILKFNVKGPYTIAWPAECKHAQGIAPTLSTTIDDIMTFTLYTIDGGVTIPTFYSGNSR